LEKVLPDFLHELSSPIALLEYSLENLMLDYQKVIKILTELAFNSQAKDSTLDLLNYVQSLNIDYSKKTNNIESREKRKIISDALASYKFKHTHRAADYMIIAGINEINENLDTILKSTEGEKLFELLISFISVNQSFSILDTAKLRARNLIGTLKNYTRKKNSSGTNTFDLKTSIDVALLMMGHQLRSRNFEFNYEANCFLDADIQKLSNVWINLLTHAIESTNCSGQIILKVFTVENQVMVTLEDNGKIVTPEHIKQLQNPDYSSNLSENISKLFTCKKYLDTINAKLSIDSNQQSTLFTITFSDYATSEK
jgi:signal transduction histidine kinase